MLDGLIYNSTLKTWSLTEKIGIITCELKWTQGFLLACALIPFDLKWVTGITNYTTFSFFFSVQQWVPSMKNIKMKMDFCTLPTAEKTPLECDRHSSDL